MIRTLAALSCLALAAPAAAAPTRAAVEARLTAEGAFTPEDPGRLGPGTDALLMAIAADARAPLPVRARAFIALQYFPAPAVKAFLEREVAARAASREELILLGRAIRAYGAVAGDAAVPRIEPLLADPHPDVRWDAAQAARAARGPQARAAAAARLKVESAPAVRQILRDFVDPPGPRPAPRAAPGKAPAKGPAKTPPAPPTKA